MTFDIVIALDTVVMLSCLIVFIVYLLHCMSLFFLLTVYYVYSYIQLLAASVFTKFSVSVSVSIFDAVICMQHVASFRYTASLVWRSTRFRFIFYTVNVFDIIAS